MVGSMRRAALSLPLLPLLLAGCARPPAASLDPAATLRELRAAPAQLPAGELAPALTELAWKEHPELRLAQAQLAAAQAGIRTAQALPNPSFGFSATKADGIPQPWTLSYGLSLPIETGGKRSLRVRQAELNVDGARLAVADAAWKLRSGIRAALVDWHQAKASARAAEREAQLRAELLRLQERRLELGEIGQPERAAAALDARRADAARFAAEAELRRSESALAQAAGRSVEALRPRLDAEAAPSYELPAESAPPESEALIHRLDLRQTLLDWDRNETALQQELAQRVPNLVVGPGYSLDEGVRKWSLGFTVDLPLFDRRQGPIAEAVARREVLRAQLRVQEQAALLGAQQAELRLDQARRRLNAQRAGLEEQRHRLAAAQRAFELGRSDRGERLAAELESLQAEQLALEAWAEVQRARLAVEDAFQKSLDPAERPFDPDGGQP